MKFQSVYPDPTYVYMGQRVQMDMGSGFKQLTPPMRAKFKEHFFDSDEGQREFGWSDEIRENIEQYLVKHKDFGHRIYYDTIEEQKPAIREDAATIEQVSTPAGMQAGCATMTRIGGEVVPCPNPAAEGADFCLTCLAELNDNALVDPVIAQGSATPAEGIDLGTGDQYPDPTGDLGEGEPKATADPTIDEWENAPA